MKKQAILIILTFLWVGIIFSFSLQPAEVSSGTSSGFARRILSAIVPNFIEYMEQMSQEELDLLHYLVRKAAHFTEYLILGILSCLTAMESLKVHTGKVAKSKSKKTYSIGTKESARRRGGFYAQVFCIGIASIDETIQLFVSGRAGQIQDVMLDSFGAVCGILIVSLLSAFRKSRLVILEKMV